MPQFKTNSAAAALAPAAAKRVLIKPPVNVGIGSGSLKDSAPNVSQTPEAVMGSSNSLPKDKPAPLMNGKNLPVEAKTPQTAVSNSPDSPGVARAPTLASFSQGAVEPAATVTTSANVRPLIGPAADKRKPVSAHTSLAKTIAEQTPNAIKTLGPGFNNRAPAEKSFSTKVDGATLSNSVMPSDYEHIFHAPSQMLDVPPAPPSVNTTKRHHKKSAKAKHSTPKGQTKHRDKS